MRKGFRKKATYIETFRKGLFDTDRNKYSKWSLDGNVWIEINKAGQNSDGTEFVQVTFNNLYYDRKDKNQQP